MRHLSPDGKYLATTDDKGVALRLLDTGETRRLPLPDGEFPQSVEWAPDGTRLFVGSVGGQKNGSIWTIPVLMGGARRIVGDGAYAPFPSPDGALIFFLRIVPPDIQELWIAGAQGESPRRLTGLPQGWRFAGRAWSPDGKRIAYLEKSGRKKFLLRVVDVSIPAKQ